MNWQTRLFEIVPWWAKEFLVGVEAIRRNYYRRYGDYASIKQKYNHTYYFEKTYAEIKKIQKARLFKIVNYARKNSIFYRDRLSLQLDDITKIPLLTKDDIRNYSNEISCLDYSLKKCWKGMTSGSTGTPLKFFVPREGIRARYAIQDNYYMSFGCNYKDHRIRFGGSIVKPASNNTPPFWIYNKIDRQLQMSPYHMNNNNLPYYIHKINKFKPQYITGYAHSIYFLAKYLVDHGTIKTPIKAIFTDSEGIPQHYYDVIEDGFKTNCYETYGLGEVGFVAVQCKNKIRHVLELSNLLEVTDRNGNPLPEGETGMLVVTDLTQAKFPYLRYLTGDIGSVKTIRCSCGWEGLTLSTIDGRSDDLILTPSGQQIGRLSHVTKPAKGIIESQIAHVAHNEIIIRVVPADNFDKSSMKDVLLVARRLLGDEIKISWAIVDSIPRTSRYKFKHVVREF